MEDARSHVVDQHDDGFWHTFIDRRRVINFDDHSPVAMLNRKRWNTRIELANAIFEYIEGFHNRRRRHSAIGWQTPLEFENIYTRQLTSLHR